MAQKYEADSSKDVKFGIVYESDLGEDIHQYDIRAFPTYVMFQNNREVNRVEGVNFVGIEGMIAEAGCEKELTGGHTLSGETGVTPLSPEEARKARLAKLGAPAPAAQPAEGTAAAAAAGSAPREKTAAVEPEKKEEAKDTEMKDAEDKDENKMEGVEETEEVCPTAKLDQEAVKQLTESMGFSLIRAQKGLLYGTGGTVEGAVEWLMQHQDDEDIDDPIPKTIQKAQSYKCNECGKILSSMANLELHANKTGHSDFEESTQSVTPLTEEEKAKKVAEIKELLKMKRAEREEVEKVDQVAREKARRLMGKEMAKTREQMDAEQRKRDAIARKREKEAAKRERDRIRAELEKDKMERRSNKGKLSSKLGVEGYNPDAIQYDQEADVETPHTEKKKPQVSANKIDEYIAKVSGYKAGGDGGKCLKVLKAYIGNPAENPDEEKYKSINMDNKVYKTKVKPFMGAKSLLMAVGFTKKDGEDVLVLKEDADLQLMKDTKAKLEKAIESY